MLLSSSSPARCGVCYEDPLSLLTIDNVLQCQKWSDFLISIAYFSIPLELFYFVTCASIFPFRWVLLQFGSFIVLCGLTHLATTFTYSPHSFFLVLTLTVLKFFTALVSIATAVTLLTLIPQMLRIFVREGLLREKTRELDREVGIMKRQEEANWHVRMLTREIRRSLDRHTILYTTLVELSKVLLLEHCAIWTPAGKELVLSHEMSRRDLMYPQVRRWSRRGTRGEVGVGMDDKNVVEIVGKKGAVLLGKGSRLICVRGKDDWGVEIGPAVAIRMPLLNASNFDGGMAEIKDAHYAVLVLVLPGEGDRRWMPEDLEIVEVVADQVAVALSHAAVLEDSMAVREQLIVQNVMLTQERKKVEQANQARILFQMVMNREIEAPARLMMTFFSALQLDNLSQEQMNLVKGGSVLSSIVQDAAANSLRLDDGRLELIPRPFSLHSLVAVAANLSKLLCAIHAVRFECRISKGIPEHVIGDERRIFRAVLYMVGHVLTSENQDVVVLHVSVERMSQGYWKPSVFENSVKLRFRVGRADYIDEDSSMCPSMPADEATSHVSSHAIYGKLAELMCGSLSVTSTSKDKEGTMNFRFRLQEEKQSLKPRYKDQETALILLRGMKILVAESNGLNRAITKKNLERTGCELTTVSSWHQCLETFYLQGSQFHILLIDMRILQEGDDISGRIRKLRSESWLLIIALVPSFHKDTKDRCLQTGMHGVVRTPVILQEMIDEIQRITQQLQVAPAFS